jgi:hypothetical protein
LMFKDTIPNASSHYGVGDVIAWSGIKRAGSATVMGQAAAQNIYASILNSEISAPSILPSDAISTAPHTETGTETERYALTELPAWAAVIGLAVGKQCLTYDPTNGMKYGVDVMQGYFGDDLGWAANLKYLGLTDVIEKEGLEEPEKVEMGEVGVEIVEAVA